MDKFPLVSVIVPCYNLHNYILDCLKSLANQDYPNYEVIVVDDGSKDDSAAIIQHFIAGKENFRLYRKENGGISSSRNAGLRQAKGEWVSFVDGDDLVGPRYLSAMMDGLREHPAELCIASATAWNVQTGQKKVCRPTSAQYGSLPEDLQTYSSCVFVWARMYSMRIIREQEVFFDETVRFGEDRPFNFSYLRFVKHYVFVEDASYLYRVEREGSLTNSIVYPQQKSFVYGYVRRFLDSCGDNAYVKESLKNNHHFLLNMADMLLGDAVHAAVVKDKPRYMALVQDDMGQYILSAYQPSEKKMALFVKLVRKGMYGTAVLLSSVYYNKRVFRWLKRSRLG